MQVSFLYLVTLIIVKNLDNTQKSHLLPSVALEFFIQREIMEFIFRHYSPDPISDFPLERVAFQSDWFSK